MSLDEEIRELDVMIDRNLYYLSKTILDCYQINLPKNELHRSYFLIANEYVTDYEKRYDIE